MAINRPQLENKSPSRSNLNEPQTSLSPSPIGTITAVKNSDSQPELSEEKNVSLESGARNLDTNVRQKISMTPKQKEKEPSIQTEPDIEEGIKWDDESLTECPNQERTLNLRFLLLKESKAVNPLSEYPATTQETTYQDKYIAEHQKILKQKCTNKPRVKYPNKLTAEYPNKLTGEYQKILKAKCLMDLQAEYRIELKANYLMKLKAESQMDLETESQMELKAESLMELIKELKAESLMELKTESQMKLEAESQMKLAAESQMELKAEYLMEFKAESLIKLKAECLMELKTTHPQKLKATELKAECLMELKTTYPQKLKAMELKAIELKEKSKNLPLPAENQETRKKFHFSAHREKIIKSDDRKTLPKSKRIKREKSFKMYKQTDTYAYLGELEPAKNNLDIKPKKTTKTEPSHTNIESENTTDAEGSSQIGIETSNIADPETSNTADPEASNQTDPEASNQTDPEASNQTDPEASNTADPEASNTADPEASKTPDTSSTDLIQKSNLIIEDKYTGTLITKILNKARDSLHLPRKIHVHTTIHPSRHSENPPLKKEAVDKNITTESQVKPTILERPTFQVKHQFYRAWDWEEKKKPAEKIEKSKKREQIEEIEEIKKINEVRENAVSAPMKVLTIYNTRTGAMNQETQFALNKPLDVYIPGPDDLEDIDLYCSNRSAYADQVYIHLIPDKKTGKTDSYIIEQHLADAAGIHLRHLGQHAIGTEKNTISMREYRQQQKTGSETAQSWNVEAYNLNSWAACKITLRTDEPLTVQSADTDEFKHHPSIINYCSYKKCSIEDLVLVSAEETEPKKNKLRFLQIKERAPFLILRKSQLVCFGIKYRLKESIHLHEGIPGEKQTDNVNSSPGSKRASINTKDQAEKTDHSEQSEKDSQPINKSAPPPSELKKEKTSEENVIDEADDIDEAADALLKASGLSFKKKQSDEKNKQPSFLSKIFFSKNKKHAPSNKPDTSSKDSSENE